MAKIDFRQVVKKRMIKKKINIPELARQVGLNVQTLYNYFAGKSEMTSANLEVILDILDFNKID